MNALEVVREIEFLDRKMHNLRSLIVLTQNDINFAHIEFDYLEEIVGDYEKQKDELKLKLKQTEIK